MEMQGSSVGAHRDFVIDESRAPVIRVVYPDVVEEEPYRLLFEQYVALCRRHRRIAWLIDMRHFNPVMAPAPLRRAAADVFAAARSDLVKSTVCEVRVVESAAARGILMAFDWLTGHKWPVKNVATLADAERWIASQLAP